MNKKLLLLLVLPLLILAGAGVFLLVRQQNLTSPQGDSATQTELSQDPGQEFAAIYSVGVPLAEQNASTQMGGASLVENEGKVTVTLDVTDIGDTSQPAHIHLGACPTPGEVRYSLTPVKNGKSVTVLEATLEDILTELPMAINIHKSSAEASVYTACGDVTLPSEE